MSEVQRVAVLGAGITGLSAAYRLTADRKPGDPIFDVRVFEASGQAGGVIRTQDRSDFVMEEGPDSMIVAKPHAVELCKELGLESRLISTQKANRRSKVAYKGALYALPDGFVMLAPSKLLPMISSPLFSLAGKARTILELFVPKRTSTEDESVSSFVRRRFGKELAIRIAQPMVGGIYMGDIERLSVRSALPNFVELERQYGSVIKGLTARVPTGATVPNGNDTVSGARYSMFVSLDRGLKVLVDELKKRIGDDKIAYNARVKSISQAEDGLWSIETEGASYKAHAVLSCLPAHNLALLVESLDKKLSGKLASIDFSSSVVVNLLFKDTSLKKTIDCFGFVVPGSESRSLAAISFSSTKYAGRAPHKHVVMRAFVGGELHPEVFHLSDDELIKLVRDDLEYYLGIHDEPVEVSVTRWEHSMPQYHVGHESLVEELESIFDHYPGLFFAGNSYRGVGIPDCIKSATDAARAVALYLGKK